MRFSATKGTKRASKNTTTASGGRGSIASRHRPRAGVRERGRRPLLLQRRSRREPGGAQAVERASAPQPNQISGFGYVDRFGKVHVPFDEALEIGRAFRAVEPATVLTGVESTERKWSQTASQPAGDYIVSLPNEYRASWAIIRQWTGHDPAIAQREATLQRLERLVWDGGYALQKAGLDSEANRLRRALTKE